MKSILFKRGQSLTEIALIIGVVGVVLIGMEVYFKRGLQGKIKDLTDSMVGKEHSYYQQDTSGLEINESASTAASEVQVISGEGAGGQRSLSSQETSVITYTSESQDSLAN